MRHISRGPVLSLNKPDEHHPVFPFDNDFDYVKLTFGMCVWHIVFFIKCWDRVLDDKKGESVEILLWAIIGALIGIAIGESKGRRIAGFLFGLLLGPLGWLIIAVGPNMNPKCPLCGGVTVPRAVRCRNCGADLAGAPQKQDASAV